MSRALHHAAIQVADVEASLRFWRDGIGLEVLMDHEFDGDWPHLLDAPDDRLRAVFLGDPASPDAGIVELVSYPRAPLPMGGPNREATGRFLLLSFYVDVPEVLTRLEALGCTDVRRIEVPGPAGAVEMATVRDPDGVMVELIHLPS